MDDFARLRGDLRFHHHACFEFYFLLPLHLALCNSAARLQTSGGSQSVLLDILCSIFRLHSPTQNIALRLSDGEGLLFTSGCDFQSSVGLLAVRINRKSKDHRCYQFVENQERREETYMDIIIIGCHKAAE